MVLTYWQQTRTQAALSRIFGTDPDLGTPASRVLRLRTSALNVFYNRVSLQDVHRWLAERTPVITLVHTAELPYWSERCAHTVVVVGIDDTGVWVNDPAFDEAPLCVPADDFMLACDAMDNYAVVIRPVP